MTNSRPVSALAAARNGFALLVSLVLMGFIFMLLLALSAFTQVETQSAASTHQLEEARQNALLALSMAVGQLQTYAGPDQRVTAPANLKHGADKPNGRWVGVYGSTIDSGYERTPQELQTDLANAALVDATSGSSARVLTWLVSGNEEADFDAKRGGSHIGSSGQVLLTATEAESRLPVKPADAVSGLGSAVTAVSEGIVIGGKPARLLVGPGTTASEVIGGAAVDYVAAPLVDVPVRDAAGNTVIAGRYAWWVGEENTKARINLPLPSSLEEKRNAFLSSPRSAIELMAGSVAYSDESPESLTAARIGSAYDPASADVAKLLDVGHFASLGSGTAMEEVLRNRFHDLSASSVSLLTDTNAGGLRQDLSRLLASSATSPAGSALLWQPLSAAENTTFIPTWGHLRSFYNTRSSNGVIQPQLPLYGNSTTGQTGISPVIAYATLGFRYSSNTGAAEGAPINFNIYPIVALWNPYDKTIAAEDYEVGIGFTATNSRIELQVFTGAVSADYDDPDNWEVRETRDLRYEGELASGGGTNPMKYFRFKVTAPAIAPGETIVFTLSNASGTYNSGSNVMSEGLNPSHYVTLSDTTILPGEGGVTEYRVVGKNSLQGSGQMAAYLGSGAASTGGSNASWDPLQNEWYQVIQMVDYPAPWYPAPAGSAAKYKDPGSAEVVGATRSGSSVTGLIYADADPLQPPSSMYDPQIVAIMMNVYSSMGTGFILKNAYGSNIPRYRWIAQGNARAPYAHRSIRDPNRVMNYYGRIGTPLLNEWPTWYRISPSQDEKRASSGDSMDYDWRSGKVINAKLFEVPDQSQTLFSVGQLQHANLSLSSAYPSYPVGNAIADFRLPDGAWLYTQTGSTGYSDINARHRTYYDISWLLNRALWDKYYFSALSGGSSLNPRYATYSGGSGDAAVQSDLQNAARAAARLMVEGGFNVNSTSEQAWRALLGGGRGMLYDPLASGGEGGDAQTESGTAFPRFSRPVGSTDVPSGTKFESANIGGSNITYIYSSGDDMETLWEGYRELSDDQISQLARNLVAEVRARGPFVSLADFVNRRVISSSNFITAPANGDDYSGRVRDNLTDAQKRTFMNTLKGALQAAIDATNLPAENAFAINSIENGSYWNATRTMSGLPSGENRYYSLAHARGDLNSSTDDKTPSRATAAFAPKYLTQADVLSVIGPSLTARSDTFVIRTLGESVNPANGRTKARAWCEAIVQRVPQYVDASDAPHVATDDLSDINKALGRKFQLISFRWLTQDEI